MSFVWDRSSRCAKPVTVEAMEKLRHSEAEVIHRRIVSVGEQVFGYTARHQ